MTTIFDNHEWLIKHSMELEKYAGKWIAIGEQKLLAVADSFKELMNKQEVKSVKNPYIMQLPLQEDAYAIL